MKPTYKRIAKRSSAPASTAPATAPSGQPSLPTFDSSISVEDRFCEKLLPWDFSSDVDLPSLQSVYSSYEQYLQAWEPVLIDEIRANILSEINSSSRWNNGKFSYSNFAFVKSTSRVQYMNYTIDYSPASTALESVEKHSLANMDLILITYVSLPNSLTSGRILQMKSSTYILGIILSSKRNEIQMKVLTNAWTQWMVLANQYHKSSSSSNLSDGEQRSFPIYYVVLNGLMSSYREYSALFSIQKSPLLSTIIQLPHSLTPPQSPLPYEEDRIFSDIGTQLYPILKNNYNSSQLEAIYISAERNQRGITLIQGPPGMGFLDDIL